MKPSKAFTSRFQAAKRWRDPVRPYIEEIFRFCAPGRESDFTNRARGDAKTIPEPTVYHSLGEEVATDLAGDLVTYFTPPEARWASYAVVSEVGEDDQEAVLKIVQERESDLFNLVSLSNYNDIAPQWAFEAATHGTPALWVTQTGLGQPIHFEAVPPHELYITPGHLGYLDRFREKMVPADTLEALLANDDFAVRFTDEPLKRKMDKPGEMVRVCWGFWLDWSDVNRPRWRMEITVDDKRVTDEEVVLGDMAGACPLLVGRFNPQPGRPWGRGAGWKALPDLRVLDKIDEVVLTNLDQSLLSTLIYPDDGFLDLSEGIEAGRAYPAHRGFTREQVYELQRGGNLDYGFYTEQNFEQRIRTAFYQDGPRQRGETPPTATQWVDERRRVQQRIGKPSAPLWSELIKPLIQRVEYLGVRSGDLPEAISHAEKDVLVTPISPLQKAQNNDKVMTTRANLDLAFNVLQDQTVRFIDPIATLRNVVTASGDELLVIRQEEQPLEPAAQPAAPAVQGQ